MCSIIASFSKEKLLELYKLNAYRGELSYSLAAFENTDNKIQLNIMMKDKGKLPEVLLTEMHHFDNAFYIAHSQAPTQESDNIHPAVYGNCFLWHNGIIKQKTLTPGTWDTEWILEQITNYGWSSLSRIDGTFACIMYNDGELFVFRNEIAPLFYDTNLNFSSTKFEDSMALPADMVFKMNLKHRKITPIAFFETMENPYYIPEEI